MSNNNDSPFDLNRAPFFLVPGVDSAQAAEEIIACFEVAGPLSDKLTRAAHTAMTTIGIPSDAVVACAVAALAAEIDAGVGDGRANPYHNSQHYCEVMLSALYLSAHAGLESHERARMVAAALAHDFHHDGRSSIGVPFRLERLAVQASQPYFEMAGVAADEVARIAVLVLSTETTVGVPFARKCYAHFTAGEPLPDALKAEPRLAVLREDARLACQAVLLAEADLLPSVGLTVFYGELTQANLAREWGRTMTAVDKLFFLEKIFGDFVVGRFFSPNVARLKDAMRRKAVEIVR
jgi:hypothetical protein